MKLVMTLVVRNEADIVAANIDYHLANGVDFVIATDHGSDDGTTDILHDYERLGVLEAIRDEQPGHHQSQRVNNMVALARRRHRADWVINNDADEFWWPQLGSLQDVFALVPARYAQISVPRRNFRPLLQPATDEAAPFYERLIYREAHSPHLAHQPKVAHRPLAKIVIAPGNHSLTPYGLPCLPLEGMLEILHFPMRSYEQFEHKVVQIGVGYEQLTDRSPGVGRDQLRLLETQRSGLLREHYHELALDESSLADALREGTIVVDRRLRHFMQALPLDPQPPRQDAPFAAKLLSGAMNAVAELEDVGVELEQARGQSQHWQDQAKRLERRTADLQARITELDDKFRSVSETLELVRNSRLMRYTSWLRRIYYRTRKEFQER